MNIATVMQDPIEFSIGQRATDNQPEQQSVPDFKAFTEVIWAHTSDRKGMAYLCTPLSVGVHKNQTKYPGEKTWRQKHLVKPRRFLSLDIDGMTPPTWVWLKKWLRDQRINCCWYTTASHTLSEPRVRIVFELNRLVSREEGITLGQVFEKHIHAKSPYRARINFDPCIYRGEQPFFLPVVNDETMRETKGDGDAQCAIWDQQPMDVDLYLSKVSPTSQTATELPAVNAWQKKSQFEQTEHIEAFKQALRDWAKAGANKGFDSHDAQAKEAALRQIGSIWNWCWVFDESSRADMLAELLKTAVNELGDQGRTKWLATVMLAARLAPAGSDDAEYIKQQVFDWSERHECYEDDYDAALDEFEKVWAEGESTTSETNLPIKLLFNLRKQKKHLPQLLMTDNTELDVLARTVDISDAFGTLNDLTYAELKPSFEKLFPSLNAENSTQQLSLFDEPHEAEHDADERFRFWAASELHARKPIEWRVKHVLPKRGLAAVYGASGSGKTFLVLDLLARVSLGRDFFGHKAIPCPIVYACLEGLAGISNRVKAWEEKYQTTLPSSFRIMADQLSLANQDAHLFALAVSRNGLSGGVIVIDTLNQSAPTADENSSKDMGTIIQNAQTIQRLTNSLVILVHHTGKDKSRGLRGHSSLIAALDAAIEVKQVAGFREWALTKAKDAENIAGQVFLLESVSLGVDDEGEPISTCVVRSERNVVLRKPPTGKNQLIVYEALPELLADNEHIAKTELIDRVKPRLEGDPKRQGARAREAIKGLLDSGHIVETETGAISLSSTTTT